MSKKYFVQKIENDSVILSKQECEHIAVVMRKKVGDIITVTDGNGTDYQCEIVKIFGKNIDLKILNFQKNDADPKVDLGVFQAVLKGDKLDYVCQKICELGASDLYLFDSKFCQAKISENKIERLGRISIESCKQCGRSTPLKICGLDNISSIIPLLKEYDKVLLAYENDTNNLRSAIDEIKTYRRVAIIVGSEGGFSKDEIELLVNSCNNLLTVSLGNRILRGETACISLCAITMYELGEFAK